MKAEKIIKNLEKVRTLKKFQNFFNYVKNLKKTAGSSLVNGYKLRIFFPNSTLGQPSAVNGFPSTVEKISLT